MSDHDPKCLAYGYGPGQRMDICICTGIRIGRADEREKIAQAIEAAQALYATGVHDARWAYKDAAQIARNGSNDA